MDEIKHLFWLVSYPKSGNTWTRAVIASLRNESEVDPEINELNTGAIASARGWVENALDFDIDELSDEEVDLLRPAAYTWHAAQMQEPEYHKVHDAYTFVAPETPMFPLEDSAGVVYIVRNPLDVAVSFSHHISRDLDTTIANMSSEDFCLSNNKRRLTNQLRQKHLTWSQHVQSWLDAKGAPKLIVRYEDMKRNSIATFTRIAEFLRLPSDFESISKAVTACSIDKLQAQESNVGFREKPAKASHFFRKGIVGDWQNHLSYKQVQTIIAQHGDMMRKLGYLDDFNNPCVEASPYLNDLNGQLAGSTAA